MQIIPFLPVTQVVPDYFKLGKTEAEVNIETMEENFNAAVSLARQATYSLNIFTQNFDPEIFDNEKFEAALSVLARKHRNAEVKILVQDSSKAVKNGHRIVRLAQQLTSSIFIRNPAKEHKDIRYAFLVADSTGLLFRPRAVQHNYHAAVNFMSPQRATKLNEYFIDIWDRSDIDQHVRRLYM